MLNGASLYQSSGTRIIFHRVRRFGYIDKTGATVIKPQFSDARSFVGKLAHASLGMSEDEALLKALQDQKAGKPKDEIEKELESNKKNYGLIDRTGKFVWKQIN